MAVVSPSLPGGEKKHWWLTNRKMVEKYVREAKILMGTHEHREIASALNLLDAALSVSPRFEQALELKARSLLYLRRFKDIADMLQDYIPSVKMMSDLHDSSSSSSSTISSSSSDKERVKLLSSSSSSSSSSRNGNDEPHVFKCFSVSDLKKKVMASLGKNTDKEGHWRYLILGQACCHLGLMEDALVLLQTGKRLATAASRKESISLSEDSFSFTRFPLATTTTTTIMSNNQPSVPPKTESESISHLLSHIKLLLRRKTSAIAALDAGLYSEAIRHFSKIVDGRRGAPKGFLAECYLHRAAGYRSAGRIAEAIADCNRTLSLDPSCIQALHTRASLFETVRCLPDSLHDLEHLKLLYNSMLRDRKLPGPIWKRQNVYYTEIPGKLCSLAAKMQQLKLRVASGETGNVDYYALIGVRRGCTRSELERAHLLLVLRHKPDKSISFIERCEFANQHEEDSVKDRAKMSALLLYRLIQKGYTSLMTIIIEEEANEKQKKKASPEPHQIKAKPIVKVTPPTVFLRETIDSKVTSSSSNSTVYQGVFCRDLAIVGNLLSQVGFNRPLPLKYEALSC